jgi:hypothetical protein
MRNHQKSRKEIAATEESGKKKKRFRLLWKWVIINHKW